MHAFQEIRLEDRRPTTSFKANENTVTKRRDNKSVASDKGKDKTTRRCFNCGEKDHVSANARRRKKAPSVSSAVSTDTWRRSVPLDRKQRRIRARLLMNRGERTLRTCW